MIQKASQSSIKKPKTLLDSTVSRLLERLQDEYAAYYFYKNASNWCAEVGYLKAAAFFDTESKNELEHADGLQKYMTDWNVYPTLPSIKPALSFANLIDIVNKAYSIEYALWVSYNDDSHALFSSDLTTFDFLTKYREGQAQSVVEYSDLLDAAMLVNVENNFEVLYYEQTYF
jgi:ferritin